jgi:predicted histone-like DNA-binding protein
LSLEPNIENITGEKKFYASANSTGEMTLVGLTKFIEKISTVSGADIRAVLYAMVDVMQDALANGQIVRLGELGSLRVTISSDGKEVAEDVNAAAIKGARVVFTPGMLSPVLHSFLSFLSRV